MEGKQPDLAQAAKQLEKAIENAEKAAAQSDIAQKEATKNKADMPKNADGTGPTFA